MNQHCDRDIPRAVDCTCQLLPLLPAVQQIADKYRDFIGGLGDSECELQEPLQVTRPDRNYSLKVKNNYYLEDSEGSEDGNVSPREEVQNGRQRNATVTTTPSTRDVRATSPTPLEMLRVPNQSCPVHVKNTEEQSRPHHAIHVCRSRKQSQSNSSILNHLTTNTFSLTGNQQHTTQRTASSIGNETNSIRKIFTIITIIGFLVLSFTYKST